MTSLITMNTSGTTQLPQNPLLTPKKLSTEQVFDRIRPLMCSIDSTIGESSGFLIHKKGIVLTVAHNIPYENRNENKVFTEDLVQVTYGNKVYFPNSSSEKIVYEHARVLDLYSLEIDILNSELETIPMLPDNIKLKEGMKVYFAGYPLGQATITFHKGLISSVTTDDQGITQFTIDGTVVPGNSGGPVVIQHEGSLYLIGVITSEVTDLTPEDQKIIGIMKALKKLNKNNRTRKSVGGIVINSHGITTSVTVKTPQGFETVSVSDRDTIVLALDLFQRNLSTGIGKAIVVNHYDQLFKKTSELKTTSLYSVSVVKGGKKLIAGKKTYENRIVKYQEVRYGRGKGHRGININFKGKSFEYKFSPNPHDSPGYNKDQEELYSKVFNCFLQIINTNPIPQEFSCEVYKLDYTCTLQES